MYGWCVLVRNSTRSGAGKREGRGVAAAPSAQRCLGWCAVKRSTGHTHTHLQRTTLPTPTHTHTHDKNNSPTPQTNTSHKHLTTLEGGATTVRATYHARVGGRAEVSVGGRVEVCCDSVYRGAASTRVWKRDTGESVTSSHGDGIISTAELAGYVRTLPKRMLRRLTDFR